MSFFITKAPVSLRIAGVIWREMGLEGLNPDGAEHAARLPAALAGARHKRRREWLGGRLCAEAATAALGQPAWLAAATGAPIWPAGIAGAISHRGDRVIAVASRDHLLGVDCELLLDADAARRLAPGICQTAETDLRPDHLGWAEAVTLLFSAKEASYKAFASGLDRVPDWREVRAVAWNGHEIQLAWGARNWPVRWQLAGREITTLVARPREAAGQ